MLEVMDWFCGAGGSSQGIDAVPHTEVTRAANHWVRAIESHEANFPTASHYRGDIREAPVEKWATADIFWASPECPQWSSARGKKRDYDATMQGDLFDTPRDEEADRSRALMEEVPLYLRGVIERGGKVRAGVVENVIEVRNWDQWPRWVGEIRKLGYRTRLIALNSMHAQPARTTAAPQSRDRLYLAYWDEGLGREPDWDKWLRPTAFCPDCQEWVQAIQVFKRAGADMGRYRQQYVYRCPRTTCRNAILEPPATPAAAAIDWSLPATRIGDRPRPLSPKTLARIQAGIDRYWSPLIVEAAGNTYDAADPKHPGFGRADAYMRAWPLDEPLRTVHTTASKALVVPAEGRDGKQAAPCTRPLRTLTTRNETGMAFLTQFRDRVRDLDPAVSPLTTVVADGANHGLVTAPPFITELRGGGSDARPVADPLATVTASGNHHGLVMSYHSRDDAVRPAADPIATVTAEPRHALLMRNNTARGDQGHMSTPVSEPARTITTTGHQSLLEAAAVNPIVDINDVHFRMLEPAEIGRAMAFAPTYIVLGNKRERVRQYGNAVTPPVAEVIVSALVEAITGEDLDRWPTAA